MTYKEDMNFKTFIARRIFLSNCLNTHTFYNTLYAQLVI
jgi:hypothetical protein